MSEFTSAERIILKPIVATLSIKRIPESEIIKQIFSRLTKYKQMLAHLHMLVNKEYVAIPNEHDKLMISLRTANTKGYSLDKEQSCYSGSLDPLRLRCKMYKMK